MTAERWQQIERLYHSTLEREPGQRASYLVQACGLDEVLRREVEGLLAQEDEAGSFLEEPAAAIAAQCMVDPAPELVVGQTLDRYRILSLLGAGGMGIVYAAWDSRLERTVALKFLLEELTGDPEALEQFRREARALSALNHPNICDIYDIDEAEGRTFLAMEYVAGKRLDQRIGRKGLPSTEMLKYSVEMADALAKAHAAHIVHRDLKPSNIMIGEDGHAKLLDFGLAKLTETGLSDPPVGGSREPGDATRSESGTIVGTVTYISPEQAQGKKVDVRSDIFSFGAVLYEMITGRRAFPGETKASTLEAILHGEPVPIREISAATPREMERIVARCLRKDPERRFQDAADLKVALQEIKEEYESNQPPNGPLTPPRHRVRFVSLGIFALGTMAVVLAISLWIKSTPKVTGRVILSRLTSDSGLTTDPAISPDGKLLAYASDGGGDGSLDIWVRQMAGGQPLRLTSNSADNTEPTFSPDGARIAFYSQREGGGIYITSAFGGEQRLIAKPGRGPRFSPDGRWLAYYVGAGGGRATKIYVVRSTGGPPRELKTQIPWAAVPIWSPDSRHILFVGSMDPYGPAQGGNPDWWVAPMEGGRAVKTGAFEAFKGSGLDRWNPTTLMTGAAELAPAVWAEHFIVFTAGLGDTTNLWKILINPRTFSIKDPPERLTTGTERELRPSLTADGRLVFATIDPHLDLWTLALDANRGKITGNPQQLTRSGPDNKRPCLSADGQRLIFMSHRSGNADIWLRDMRSGKETALTATPWNESHPFLSADGSRFAYGSLETGDPAIYVQTVGTGAGEKLCGDCGLPFGWSADGRSIFWARGHPSEWKSIDVATRQKMEVIHQGKYTMHMLRQSPDGDWVAFHMPIVAEKGGSPILIAPLRNGVARAESEWIQVTDGSGMDTTPWWSPNGGILYFLSKRDGAMCIWAQHLNPKTKQPIGAPFDVAHFHSARLKVEEVGFGPGVSRDMLVFTLKSSTGDIWSAGTEIRK